MRVSTVLFFIILINNIIFSQEGNEPIVITGDSLVGKMIDGESIREVYGNVIITQGNVRITCDKAIQYIYRNDAHLLGNVVVTENEVTILTDEGYYYGNNKIAFSDKGLILNDGKVILTAQVGQYYFNEDIAHFLTNVKLYDTTSTLTSEILYYYQKENKAVALKNVKIVDADNIILADSLTHYRNIRETFADGNVSITSLSNNVIIFGGHLEDYYQRSYTLIENDPLLVQVDTSDSGIIDTLVINSEKMEAFRDSSKNIFIAKDSVKIVRGEFASNNNYTIYDRNEETLITYVNPRTSYSPVLWNEGTQLSGDSIFIQLKENKIETVEVYRGAFLLSQNEFYSNRHDQISGQNVIMNFEDSEIKSVEVTGGVLSIYYTYEGNDKNGLTKSSSQSAKIIFEEKKVTEVKLYGTPASEFYPENLVEGKEMTFLLPLYIYHSNRPKKEDLIKDRILYYPSINNNIILNEDEQLLPD